MFAPVADVSAFDRLRFVLRAESAKQPPKEEQSPGSPISIILVRRGEDYKARFQRAELPRTRPRL